MTKSEFLESLAEYFSPTVRKWMIPKIESGIDILLKDHAIKFALYYADKSYKGINDSYTEWIKHEEG